ncbi:maternal protein exuperantia isoform X2 [Zootermopsis nevadensis]|nr:maternal protein exuperantia isoform X2 [Zootermopsis nevadensis]XP_021919451.1 maternal protein exuperantia isoform X2 [Zootermopsis nevadensis]
MVSTTVMENGIKVGEVSGLPAGEYSLVGWDLDTTGRRLIDEICHIAAYSPADTFSQYVMPFCDLNIRAQRRHNIRVITVGRYRMLKDCKTGKVLKTKSEIYGLSDFIHWLEIVKGNAVDGVILVSHEPRMVAAPLLLEALQKYNLLERFSAVVKGFANGYRVAEVKCAKTVRSFSLRTLSRVLLNNEEDLDSAADRARLAFQIVQHLCAGEDRPESNQGSGDGQADNHGLAEAIRQFTNTVAKEEMELVGLKTVLKRQASMRPVFGPLLSVNRRERQRASNLRRILAEAEIDYPLLTATYSKDGKESITQLLASKLTQVKPKERDELHELLMGHFDPESKPKSEKTQVNKESKYGVGDVSGSSTPDTTTSSMKTPVSSDDNTNTNCTISPQTSTTSPQKHSTFFGPVVTSSPESTVS